MKVGIIHARLTSRLGRSVSSLTSIDVKTDWRRWTTYAYDPLKELVQVRDDVREVIAVEVDVVDLAAGPTGGRRAGQEGHALAHGGLRGVAEPLDGAAAREVG